MNHPVIIVGGGPAGLSAGIQLQRGGVPILLFEAKQVAHQLRQAHCVETLLGFPQISGTELMCRLEEQVAQWKLPIRFETVVSVSRRGKGFWVQTNVQGYGGQAVILATGSQPNPLPLPHDDRLRGHVVFDQVTDVERQPSGHVVVVGGGDSAFDAALRLAGCHQVSMVMKTEMPVALPLLVQRVSEHPAIQVYGSRPIERLSQSEKGVEIHFSKSVPPLRCDYVLGSIGRTPRHPLIQFPIRPQLHAAPGCYLVGDVVQGNYRQIGIAMGDGLKAAMMIIEQRLSENEILSRGWSQADASKN